MVQTSARKRSQKRTEKQALPEPRLFSVDEYYAMARAGILQPDERTELLQGVIFCMAAMGSRHAARVTRFGYRLIAALMDRALVRVQAPIHIGEHSEPEPDIAVVRLRADDYDSAHPMPQDVYLLVEVSDSSLVFDRDHKLPLYASAGIPELWIVDLPHNRVLVYHSPRGGRYDQETVVGRGGSLSPQAFPDVTFSVDDLLGLTEPPRPSDSSSGRSESRMANQRDTILLNHSAERVFGAVAPALTAAGAEVESVDGETPRLLRSEA